MRLISKPNIISLVLCGRMELLSEFHFFDLESVCMLGQICWPLCSETGFLKRHFLLISTFDTQCLFDEKLCFEFEICFVVMNYHKRISRQVYWRLFKKNFCRLVFINMSTPFNKIFFCRLTKKRSTFTSFQYFTGEKIVKVCFCQIPPSLPPKLAVLPLILYIVDCIAVNTKWSV